MLLKIRSYANECTSKIEYHTENANNAIRCWNFTTLSMYGLAIMQTVAMSIETALGVNSTVIVITGAVFTGFIMVVSKIQSVYPYNRIELQHNVLVDYFKELKDMFEVHEYKYNDNTFNEHEFDTCVKKYLHICEKTHIQKIHHYCLF